jgi:hypothetical protein
MSEQHVLDLLRELAADNAAGWVMLPDPHGAIDLQMKAKAILAHNWRQSNPTQWRDDAARFLMAVAWAGSKCWAATERDLSEIIERRRLESAAVERADRRAREIMEREAMRSKQIAEMERAA